MRGLVLGSHALRIMAAPLKHFIDPSARNG
jgi:hypothetical protein